jgi:hypothetical protein
VLDLDQRLLSQKIKKAATEHFVLSGNKKALFDLSQ